MCSSDLHGQAFISALDDHAGVDRKLDGFPPAARAVELPVVAQEPACVVYLDLGALGRRGAAALLDQNGVETGSGTVRLGPAGF